MLYTNDDLFATDTPYDERRCTRCGKHVDELEPFGDDAGIYKGVSLVKNYRTINYYERNEEYEMILLDIRMFGDAPELHEFYGSDKVRMALSYDEGRNWVERSWSARIVSESQVSLRVTNERMNNHNIPR